MEKGSSSRVKGDSVSNNPEEAEPIERKYSIQDDGNRPGWVTAEAIRYKVEIKPDKNGRLGF